MWLYKEAADIKHSWKKNWMSALMVNSHLVADPTIQQPGFDFPRQQWSVLNRYSTPHGHCGTCRKRWCPTESDLYFCGETQMMSYIVVVCQLMPFDEAGWCFVQTPLCRWCGAVSGKPYTKEKDLSIHLFDFSNMLINYLAKGHKAVWICVKKHFYSWLGE